MDDRRNIWRGTNRASGRGYAASMRFTRMNALNGWQRLWFVAAAAWAVCVVLFVYPDWPAGSDVRSLDFAAIAERYGGVVESSVPSDANGKQLAIPFWDRHRLAGARLQVGRRAFALWVLPAILVYGVGVGLTWTLRGFREHGSVRASGTRALNSENWWIAIIVLAGAIVIHAAVPRYEWRHEQGLVWSRIDRWTGELRVGTMRPSSNGLEWVTR